MHQAMLTHLWGCIRCQPSQVDEHVDNLFMLLGIDMYQAMLFHLWESSVVSQARWMNMLITCSCCLGLTWDCTRTSVVSQARWMNMLITCSCCLGLTCTRPCSPTSGEASVISQARWMNRLQLTLCDATTRTAKLLTREKASLQYNNTLRLKQDGLPNKTAACHTVFNISACQLQGRMPNLWKSTHYQG